MTHSGDTSSAQSIQADGTFDQIAGKAKAVWGDLTDDEILQAKGSLQNLYGIIQKKTGETVEAVQKKISS